MSAQLSHWLTQHRRLLLQRWGAEVEILAHSNGLPVAAMAAEERGAAASETALIHADDSVCYTRVTNDGVLGDVLTHFYEGLVLAASGDTDLLNQHLHAINVLNEQHEINLPTLLKIAFQLRRLAWGIWWQQQPQDANPADMLSLMDELTTLLETITESLACNAVEHAEKDVQDRIERAEFVAQSMAMAMEEADKTTLKLSLLNRVSQRLAGSVDTTDSSELIELIGSSLVALLDVAHVSIWLPDIPENGKPAVERPIARTLSMRRCWGDDLIADDACLDVSSNSATTPDDTDAIVQCYRQVHVICESVLDAEDQGSWYYQEYGVLALPLPMKEQNRAAGVVLLQDPDPMERFSRANQDLAMAVVSQAAISLENSLLYSEIRRFNNELGQVVEQRTQEVKAEKERLRTLHEIATEVSSTLDLDTLLHTSLQALARITEVEYGSIMLIGYDEEDLLVSRATLGSKKVNTFSKLSLGMGIPGWVAQHRKPAIVQNVQDDNRWFTLPMGDSEIVQQRGSLIAVPLIAHNELLGVLTLSHEEPGYFNEGHLRLLSASAGAISMGIHNANMYNTIVAEMERSSELLTRQRSEASKTQSILQSLSDGVLVCDTDGSVILSNPAASRILQWSLEELFLASNLHELLQQILDQRVDALPLKDLLEHPLDADREPRIFEMIVQVRVRDVQLTLNPVLNEFGELLGAMLLIRDVSREREYDRLRNEFISTMSHELRTPMTAIKGFTQLLAMGGLGPVNDSQREFLNTIQSNAERMISIINDVLDITKIETGTIELEWRSVHLAEVLSNVVSDLQEIKKIREHILHISIPLSLPLVRCDTNRLHQILQNLLSNAFKYTPNGGEVWVEAQEAVHEELPEHVRNCIRRGQNYVQMNIRDTGVGIAPEEIERVFERFYRTENPLKVEAGGTGLGLSLVKPLIELFGGFIWATSVPNEGSTFSFILPTV